MANAKVETQPVETHVPAPVNSIANLLIELDVAFTEEQLAKIEEKLEFRKVKKDKSKFFKFVKDTFEAKTPLQMKLCVTVLKDKGLVTKDEWVDLLNTHPDFKTTQPTERIIAFYQKRMLGDGLISRA